MAPPLFSPLSSLPPPSLKPLTSFIRHHRELSTADPVISYWCLYHAAQQGISTPGLPKEGKDYLLEMMDKLEEIKAALSTNDAATSDAAGSAYVENFALDVFTKADNEDRASTANKDTARAFQAAANFLELLGLFTGEGGGGMSEEINAKRVYAKWKTAEILKALRESRKPAPGPPGWDPEQERKEKEEEQEAAKAVEQVGEDDEVLAREIAKLTGADAQPAGGDVGEDAAIARALSPDGVAGSHISRRSPARLSLDATAALDQASSPPLMQRSTSSSSSVHSPPLGGAASPNFSHPLRPQLERGLTGSSSASSIAGMGQQGQQQPHLMPPAPPSAAARTSPIPGQVIVPGRPLPVPPSAGASPSAPPQQPYGQPTSPRPSAPPLPTPTPPRIPSPAAAAPAPPAPIAPPTSSLPDALSARQTSTAQRYAKYAISALDFDDLETARRNLRLALDVCEGR